MLVDSCEEEFLVGRDAEKYRIVDTGPRCITVEAIPNAGGVPPATPSAKATKPKKGGTP
jgi:hypothetical protein